MVTAKSFVEKVYIPLLEGWGYIWGTAGVVWTWEKQEKMNMTTDEDALKAAGIGWMKRKALKAATSMGSTSQKMKYKLQGNLVICSDGSEKDTLQLSPDGKFLSGKTDEKEAFRLTRTK